jgi:hypothetical protein
MLTETTPICCHHSQQNTPTADRTDDCAFGAMMSLALGRSSENYVFK